MTNREWLSRAINIDKEIKALERAKENAFSAADYTSPPFTERVQTGQSNSVEKRVIAYSDYVGQIDESLEKLAQVQSEVLATINTLEDTVERAMLIERFLNDKNVCEIANIVGYQVDTVKHRITQSVKKISVPQKYP